MLQHGNGIHVPNSDDKICGLKTIENSTTQKNIHKIIEDLRTTPVEASPFIQQKGPKQTDQLQRFIRPIEENKTISTVSHIKIDIKILLINFVFFTLKINKKN